MNAGPCHAAVVSFLDIWLAGVEPAFRLYPRPRAGSVAGRRTRGARSRWSTRRAASAAPRRPAPKATTRSASLEAGLYKVTVRKDGFRTMIRFNVKLANLEAARSGFHAHGRRGAGDHHRGGHAGARRVRRTARSACTSPDEEIQRLPLNGRGVLGLVELSPGTNVTPATRGEAGQFTANGQRPNANYFTVDGASANTGVTAGGLPAQATGGVLPAMSAFGSLDSLLPVEAVDELRVQTSNSMSDIGRLPGANVTLTSRSGTNDLHGSAVYRFRHEAGAANDWFANTAGQSRGPLRLHDVAPSLGGPIRRDRTFFFLSYQHLQMRGSYVSRQPVPSDGTRASRALLGAAGARPVSAGQRTGAGQRAGGLERPQRASFAAR